MPKKAPSFNPLDTSEYPNRVFKNMFVSVVGGFIFQVMHRMEGKWSGLSAVPVGVSLVDGDEMEEEDDAPVTIGDDCNFGPNVTIVTPVHPMLAEERRTMIAADGEERHLCYAKPVTIGNDVWMGANVVVCPGVTIGDGCVIGAGSVVTRSIPPRTFAAGNPCRVIREITEADSMINHPERLGGSRPKD